MSAANKSGKHNPSPRGAHCLPALALSGRQIEQVMLKILRFGAVCELDNLSYEQANVSDHFTRARRQQMGIDDPADSEDARPKSPERRLVWKRRYHAVDRRRRSRRRRANPRDKNRIHVRYEEFVDLSDGTSLLFRDDHGTSLLFSDDRGEDHSRLRSEERIVNDVRNYFEQLEHVCCPTSPEWIVERLQRLYGVEVDPASVHDALESPLRIELGSALLQRLE